MTALPDGLELRTARPEDLDQIATLLTDRGEDVDAVDHRLVVEDPDAGWEACAVVVDGDRVVSTATLLDESVRLGSVTIPAGQVELVATHEDYEGRGLARALMGWAHERSAARGHVLQLMIGIPYFYRLFGYEYAIDIPPARELTDVPVSLADGGPYTLRLPTRADIPALMALQEREQAGYDVAARHPEPRWRWLIETPASRVWLLERDGAPVGSVRVRTDDDGVLLADAASVDDSAADALLAAAVALQPGDDVSVVDRAGSPTGQRWAGRLGPASEAAEQYYVRVPALAPLLDALRPELERRLASAGLDRAGQEVIVSTYGAHVTIPVADDGTLGPARTGGRLPWPGSVGGAGVAPDQVGALVLGQLGMHGLSRRRPDVYPGPDVEMFEAIFPPLTADVLSYYLPW